MITIKNNIYTVLTAMLLAGAANSCSSTKYERPNSGIPEDYRHNIIVGAPQDTVSIARIPYRDFFTDAELILLINKGVAANNDLKIAIKQLDIASLAYRQTKWNNVPTLNLNIAGASINRPSDNSLNGLTIGQFLGQKYVEDYNSNLAVSWEADIWGKIKARKEAAYASFLQTQEAAKAVQTRLISEIAQGYYNLLMLDLQLDITNQNLELVENTLKMIRVQQNLGITTSLSVLQQENTRNQMLATVPVIKQNITAQENALRALTGDMPGEIVRSKHLTDISNPKSLATGIPAEMVSFRPDVKSDELLVLQALANSNIAKRSMYPSLNITAQGGLSAYQFNNWFKTPGSLFATAIGTLAQPLLNGKRLKTQYQQSKIMAEQAELRFKQTVINAVGEVSNSLTAIEALQEQQTIMAGLVSRSEEAVSTASIMYRNDLATYLDVIVAQNNKLKVELDLAMVIKQKLGAYVILYRSLGGGWQ